MAPSWNPFYGRGRNLRLIVIMLLVIFLFVTFLIYFYANKKEYERGK